MREGERVGERGREWEIAGEGAGEGTGGRGERGETASWELRRKVMAATDPAQVRELKRNCAPPRTNIGQKA